MTIKPTCILTTLVLAGLALSPAAAAAQGTRTAPPTPQTSRTPAATRPAPAPAPLPTTAGTPAPPRATTGTRTWTEQDFRIGPGDRLRVDVYGQPQLSQAAQVRPDGKITIPLVGEVMAAGRTPLELRDALTASLKEYITNPVVTATVQDVLSTQIHVMGEVEKPGSQVLYGPLTVLQALSQAGSFKEWAKKGDIRILRGASQTPIPFNYKDEVNGRSGPTFVQPGDTILVP